MDKYLDKKFPEKIKTFYKYDIDFFKTILEKSNLSITQNMHPIIAYNYPSLLPLFFNENDLSNINGSPSVVLHYAKNNLFNDYCNTKSVEFCEVIKSINNKEYTDDEILNIMKKINASKRQKSSFSKSYPSLHEKFDSVEDNFKYNMILIALEKGDYDYIEENITYALSKFKDKLIKNWWKVFFYLKDDEYTDDDILNFIDHQILIQFAKSEDTVLKFVINNNSTKCMVVDSMYIFDKMIENNINIESLDWNFLNDNALKVIKHYPHFYYELDESVITDEIKHYALYDPYNIYYIGLNEHNIKHFLNCSNINVLDAHSGLINMNYEDFKLAKSKLLNESNKFEGMFLALQSYPLLILTLLNEDEYYKHVTPYLINHSCKIDSNLFDYFKKKEDKRWSISS